MNIIEMGLNGVKLIKPRVYNDERGFFFECYQKALYSDLGIEDYPQDNISFSKKDTLRGMHFQRHPGQAKLLTLLQGRIYDVVVDIRPASPTYKQWEAVTLDAGMQLFVPVGFAHGFCVLNDAIVHYKVSSAYDPAEEKGFRWNDPDIAISWPLSNPILSQRDKGAPLFSETKS